MSTLQIMSCTLKNINKVDIHFHFGYKCLDSWFIHWQHCVVNLGLEGTVYLHLFIDISKSQDKILCDMTLSLTIFLTHLITILPHPYLSQHTHNKASSHTKSPNQVLLGFGLSRHQCQATCMRVYEGSCHMSRL